MTNKPPKLNPGTYDHFPKADLRAIIRGADEMIGYGGRALLTKLLRGSKEKKLIKQGFDKSPVYGYFSDHTLEDIKQRIDWVITEEFLQMGYTYGYPVFEHSPDGWEICKDIRRAEFMEQFDKQLDEEQRPYNMRYLIDCNRSIITTLIESIVTSGEKKYIPILEDWMAIDYNKIKVLLKEAIGKLGGS